MDQSYSYSEAYVTCAENASGEKLYVCWEFSRSKNMSLQNPLTADDPLFIEVAESLKLK